MPIIKHVSINIAGKVQGVFFRASAKEKADTLRIKGTARNKEDGSVFIEAEGNERDIEEFIAWCKNGPRLARVDRCDVKESLPRNFNTFSIER